jgi:hypothetical protein
MAAVILVKERAAASEKPQASEGFLPAVALRHVQPDLSAKGGGKGAGHFAWRVQLGAFDVDDADIDERADEPVGLPAKPLRGAPRLHAFPDCHEAATTLAWRKAFSGFSSTMVREVAFGQVTPPRVIGST